MKKDNSKSVSVDVKTFEQLFKKNVFFIPKYQREYNWTKENVQDFINDIKSNSNYYIGNALIAKRTNDIEMIDGQQRIITAYITFIALYNMFTNKKLSKFDIDIIMKGKKARVIIDERTADQNVKIFSYLINNTSLTEELKRMNEYTQYENIVKILNKMSNVELENFYDNLKLCQIILINSQNSNITSYQMFLNLNTKGLKLSDADIVKSMLISYLEKSKDFDLYRNSWFNVFANIGKYSDDYLSNYISIYETDKISKIRKNSIIDEYKKRIFDKDSALKIYNKIGNETSNYYVTYNAVVKNESTNYIQKFNESSVVLENLFNAFEYIKKIAFTQFNIAFISMLVYENSTKNRIRDNFKCMIRFVHLVFLYVVYNGLQNKSPSSYANDFVKLAVSLKQKNGYFPVFKSIITEMKISKLELNNLDFIDDIIVKQNSKELKYVSALIAFLDGSEKPAFTGEHILSQSSSSGEKFSFGNIVPVIQDTYGNKDLNEKIILYEKDKMIEPHIKLFLEMDYKGNENFTEERKKRYKNLFVEKYNQLLDYFK